MQRILKKFMTVVLSVVIPAAVSFKFTVAADEAYDVYNYDRWGEAVPSQAGYLAERSVSGTQLGISDFSSPSDIFRASDGRFYIVDTGNNRIVIADQNFSKAEIIDSLIFKKEQITLKEPSGLFIADNGVMYIADTGNSRIIKCDTDGNVSQIIEKPVTELYPDELTFLPQKVIADKAGYIYTIVNNITSGAVMYDSNGVFQGFYGASRVEKTSKVVWDHFWKMIAPEGMRKYMKNSVPAAISNFDIDDSGFIYTCSSSVTQSLDAIKKVNASGYNLFADLDVSFGDLPTPDYSERPQNSYIDVEVSDDGLINCLDYTNGRIFQYDEDCNLLFIIGSKGNQLGTFGRVSAIESDDTKLYVVDSQKNTVTIFEETVFGSVVHEATRLYNAGYYDEALEPWFEVLKRDGSYRRAYIGISSALINQGRYEEAMKYAELADSQKRYDRAFEGWRTDFVNNNFFVIFIVLTFIIIAVITVKTRKKQILKKRRQAENDGAI